MLLGEHGVESSLTIDWLDRSASLRLGESDFSWALPTIESIENPILGLEGTGKSAVGAIGIIIC